MNQRTIYLFLTLLFGASQMTGQGFLPVQNSSEYQILIDLNSRENDQVNVQVVPPVMHSDTVIYNMPAMVPGTYKVYHFGRFITDLKAFDMDGKELTVNQLNTDQWAIIPGNRLYRIAYKVDDSYDGENNDIFSPAGTSIDEDVYLLNLFGFVGYFEGKKSQPFRLKVSKPKDFYGVTSLTSVSRNSDFEEFSAPDYFTLHDCPILYSVPDTASLDVAGAKVVVGVYSPTGALTADETMEQVKPLFTAAAKYLDGSLPTDRYTVLIYGMPANSMTLGFGALEHHTSTVVNVPDIKGPFMGKMVRDITAHEFFHIVTPLNIHSEYINDFDFMDPKMSKHLWLYEGGTEYNSIIMQVQDGVKTGDEFIEEIAEKAESAADFNEDIPMTVASEFALTYFEDQYLNVYQKGALVGLCLDLELRRLSDNSMGIEDLLMKMMDTYGKDTFFLDEDLFDILTDLSYPEIREFFARYVEGAEPLPMEELLSLAGIEYQRKMPYSTITAGKFKLRYNTTTERLMVTELDPENPFSRELGIQVGDELIEWDGKEVSPSTFADIVNEWRDKVEAGDKVKVTVLRTDESGDQKKMKLSGHATYVLAFKEHTIQWEQEPTTEQKEFRNQWLNQ
ncbi:MAG: PDZ domain-containing protein [Bacteroidota bacterium]|nr:PDZ domain-containing protein [Bacteroidota bacterium]